MHDDGSSKDWVADRPADVERGKGDCPFSCLELRHKSDSC